MRQRVQKNITLTKEQERTAREIYGKMNIKDLAKVIGVKEGKTIINLKLMGLHVTKNQLETQHNYNLCKVINMESFFDVDSFGRYYNY